MEEFFEKKLLEDKKYLRYNFLKKRNKVNIYEKVIEKVVFLAGISTIVLVALIVSYLLYESIPFFMKNNILDFLFGTVWNPASPNKPSYGIVPLVYGSLLVTSLALIIDVPLGLASAIYISYVASKKEREILKPLIELLAGIPSVIYGFFALVILASVLQNFLNLEYRLNAFNGAIIIAVMALPTIISISEDSITFVPKSYYEAALALGSSKWESIIKVIVPSAKSGIIASIMLGFGRAIGETMAVIMATGNSPQILFNIFAPIQTLTSPPALEMGEVAFGSEHYHALFAVCLVLFLITLAINLLSGLLTTSLQHKISQVAKKKPGLYEKLKKFKTGGAHDQ
ncbi:MAG: phosphate ABC transporter permease subunit PstC [Candidatus Odinarchaeum yellowstonii]|uniref:Phosphate transport system permease protein n=1 Tax=Odinarchaeota yellowstonii (strain LCB_4) TaxID=1841599 RepID=A0AAF0IE16_ODILC|nr:MAG: phosphate ABC transporter permease subunit PstC [Candidatus Odinarchaeum yellowstonii]